MLHAVAFNRVVEALVLPPGSVVLLLLLSLVLWRHRRTALVLAGSGAALLYAASIPGVSDPLLMWLESRHEPLSPKAATESGAGAIVVLGGGRERAAPEYGSDVPSAATLQRLRYGVWLQRHTGLPLLASGGAPFGAAVSEARLMLRVAREELGAAEVWAESASATTAENARNCAALLRPRGIRRVLLVTHASHMPRAVGAFEAAGLEVIPAPTAFHHPQYLDLGWRALLPRARALERTNRALHEYLGIIWYALAAPGGNTGER